MVTKQQEDSPLQVTDSLIAKLSRKWLERSSKEQLIDFILALKAKLPRGTDLLDPAVVQAPPADSRPTVRDVQDTQPFLKLPPASTAGGDERADVTWRVRLIPPHAKLKILKLEIDDYVFIGRPWMGISPDLDLTEYGGEVLGVSRRHALLQPTRRGVFLIDLGSANGSFRNGSKLRSGVAQKLSDGDTIGFGGLRFIFKIDARPHRA